MEKNSNLNGYYLSFIKDLNLKKNRVLALIDGFNYYHRLDDYQSKFKEQTKWLNYKNLIKSWLLNDYDTRIAN